jgi:glycerophosphoryl diester phosphodiesterase
MFALAILSNQPADLAAVEIIGHRGASHDAPENTLASVNLAWKQNADAVEIDVFLSKDGHIVAFHDKNTARLAAVDKPVVEQTLAELSKLDVGRWMDAKFTGERIPTLSAVLATIPDGKRLFIEVKCGPEIVPTLRSDLQKAGKQPDQTAIISFSYDVVAAVKQEMPELVVYWVVGLKQDEQTGEWTPELDVLIDKAQAANLDGLDLGKADVIDKAYVSRVKKAGLGFYMWTINSASDARRLTQAGVEGLTTDRPAWLRKQLSNISD